MRAHTFPFSPPEYFSRKQGFTHKQDNFSLGMILYRMIFDDYPFFTSSRAKESYIAKDYMKRIFLAPERCEYFGNEQTMLLIYKIFFRCISVEENYRIQPSWMTIFFKLIYYHLL